MKKKEFQIEHLINIFFFLESFSLLVPTEIWLNIVKTSSNKSQIDYVTLNIDMQYLDINRQMYKN